jgi:hypothetical protein
MMLLTRPHYNVNLKSIDVDGTTLQLPAHVFQTGDKKGTIIDSGTTLAYLPELVFKSIMLAVWLIFSLAMEDHVNSFTHYYTSLPIVGIQEAPGYKPP